jgi:sialate O-acetylesterase
MSYMNKAGIATTLVLSSALAGAARADVQLPSVIGDNMVLQRNSQVAIWGWDTPNTNITVTFRGREYSTKAGTDGKWTTRVASGAAGTAFPLTIKGSSTVALKNIAVGEVWIAGGQSNMWWHVSNGKNAAEEAKNGDHPTIRVWDANLSAPVQGGYRATTPQRTVDAQWKISTPQNVPDFPGVPYFFARDLQQKLKVPIGIIHLAVPGTDIEWHMNPATVRSILPQATELADLKRQLYPQQKQAYDEAHAQWRKDKAAAEKDGKPLPKEPKAPQNPDEAAYPGMFYNAMVYPAAPFTAKGFLWWQGENNAGRAEQYRVLFPAMIDDWRKLWGNDAMPFLFVELANFGVKQTDRCATIRGLLFEMRSVLPPRYPTCIVFPPSTF